MDWGAVGALEKSLIFLPFSSHLKNRHPQSGEQISVVAHILGSNSRESKQ